MMIKKFHVILTVCIVLITFTGCTTHITKSSQSSEKSTVLSTQTQSKTTTSEDDKVNKNCTLIVNGKDITSGNYIRLNYEDHYAELPLTAVMKALGAKVEWQSKTTATITFGGKDYILDTANCSLIEKGSTFNILVIAPGSTHGSYFKVVGDEFVVDSDTIKLLVNNIMGAKINIDYDQAIINIE